MRPVLVLTLALALAACDSGTDPSELAVGDLLLSVDGAPPELYPRGAGYGPTSPSVEAGGVQFAFLTGGLGDDGVPGIQLGLAPGDKALNVLLAGVASPAARTYTVGGAEAALDSITVGDVRAAVVIAAEDGEILLYAGDGGTLTVGDVAPDGTAAGTFDLRGRRADAETGEPLDGSVRVTGEFRARLIPYLFTE